jgi:hypothetical protein
MISVSMWYAKWQRATFASWKTRFKSLPSGNFLSAFVKAKHYGNTNDGSFFGLLIFLVISWRNLNAIDFVTMDSR